MQGWRDCVYGVYVGARARLAVWAVRAWLNGHAVWPCGLCRMDAKARKSGRKAGGAVAEGGPAAARKFTSPGGFQVGTP